jgi:hypothetical protein
MRRQFFLTEPEVQNVAPLMALNAEFSIGKEGTFRNMPYLATLSN